MRIRTIAWIAGIPLVAVLGTAFAAPPGPQTAAAGGAPPVHGGHGASGDDKTRGGNLQERYLYVSTIAQSATDPDFIAVIGADPRRRDFGEIVNRVDMPNVGDELHHYGYSHDQKRLLVPGLFSNRIHVFEIKGDGKRLDLKTVNDKLAAKSGYVVPH
jgi:methanethiol oxidase